MPNPHTSERPTVLVLRFSSAGDVLLTWPVLDALAAAWPEARLVVATKSPYVDLVRTHPAVAEVVGLAPGEGLRSFRRRLAALRPQAVIDLHGKPRGWVLRRLARARSLWRQRPWYQTLAVRLGLVRYRADALVSDRYHHAVERLLGRRVTPGRLRYVVAPEHRAASSAALRAAGVDPGGRLVGMSPGSLWETKRWPAEHFGALAARLAADGWQVVLVGSRDEAPITAAVRARAPAAVDLAGVLPLGPLAGLVERCALFVANDSGPMHLSRALRVPTLALFGSTDPRMFDFTGHVALSLGLECAPCSLYGRRRCPLGHLRCLRELDVDRAYQAATRLLAGERPPAVRG